MEDADLLLSLFRGERRHIRLCGHRFEVLVGRHRVHAAGDDIAGAHVHERGVHGIRHQSVGDRAAIDETGRTHGLALKGADLACTKQNDEHRAPVFIVDDEVQRALELFALHAVGEGDLGLHVVLGVAPLLHKQLCQGLAKFFKGGFVYLFTCQVVPQGSSQTGFVHGILLCLFIVDVPGRESKFDPAGALDDKSGKGVQDPLTIRPGCFIGDIVETNDTVCRGAALLEKPRDLHFFLY